MVVTLITGFLVPAKTTFINKGILANFWINAININSQTSEKNYSLCIYEFLGPLYALSQSLVLKRKYLQLPLFSFTLNRPAMYQGRNWFNSFTLFLTKSSDHHHVFTYIWQECNGFNKGIFYPHFRPFTGGQAQVLGWLKSNQNSHAVSKRFH